MFEGRQPWGCPGSNGSTKKDTSKRVNATITMFEAPEGYHGIIPCSPSLGLSGEVWTDV